MLSIEKLNKSDISQCIAIYNQNYPNSPYRSTINNRLQEMFTTSFNRSKPTYVVLKMASTIVAFGGYAQSQFCTGTFEIFLINVIQSFQGKGFGKKIILELLLDIRNHLIQGDEQFVLLNCRKQLVDFYKMFGFNAITSRKDGEQYMMALNTKYLTRDLTTLINNELKLEAISELASEKF